ncbi:MAG: endonuclease/exonuclease/phosphatase family protein [Pseudomonadota bacterium]
MKRLLRAITSALSVAVLLGIVLGFMGGFVFELDMFAHFRLHLVLLSGVVGAAAVFLGSWHLFWRCFVAAVLGVAGLGVLWERLEHGPGTTDVTVMTANLYQDNSEPAKMQKVLFDADADVLVTAETTKTVLSGEHSLALIYPFRLSLSTSGQTLRTVIWSKYPMRDGKLLLEDLVGPTGAHAIIEVEPGLEFTLLGVHMAHNLFGNQKQQIEALDRIAEQMPVPRVVVGDFNATAWSYALRWAESLTSTRRIRGFRITWRGTYPTIFGNFAAPIGLQIDHALVSRSIGVTSVETIPIPGSDHRGLKIGLALGAS